MGPTAVPQLHTTIVRNRRHDLGVLSGLSFHEIFQSCSIVSSGHDPGYVISSSCLQIASLSHSGVCNFFASANRKRATSEMSLVTRNLSLVALFLNSLIQQATYPPFQLVC
jgi:hypothetical protein